MTRCVFAVSAAALVCLACIPPTAAVAQSSPGFFTGQVPTAAQWNSYFAAKQDVLANGGVTAPMLASGAAAANIGLVSNLAALQAVSAPAAGQTANRQGYAVPGDGGAANYVYSTSPCALNSGAGDNGAQVKPASGSGCWNIVPSAAGVDVRVWGVVLDGTTDNLAAFTTALNDSPSCVIVPAAATWAYVSGPITVSKCLRGAVWTPSQSTLSFANTSGILCNNQAAGPCVVVNRSGNLSAEVDHITLLGKGATPVAGSIGFQWQGGYNLQLRDVQIANFDTCAYFGPTAGAGLGPITAHAIGTFLSRCQKHYVVDDGIPELYFVDGRWGENGGTDYNSADDFLYATKTTNSGPGGGPNTIVLEDIHANPGGKTVGCPIRWGGFTGTGGVFEESKISNSHFEILDTGYTGSAPLGLICVDNTLPQVPGMKISNTFFGLDGGTVNHPTFNIASSLPYAQGSDLSLTNNWFAGASSTLSIGSESGGHGPVLSGNYFFNTQTFNAIDASATMKLSDNLFGTLVISGQWGRLSLSDNSGTINDTATGGVYESNENKRSWTPSLTFGGASTGMTYNNRSGTITRTPSGGFIASFLINLSSKGTATGAAQVAGLPYTCSAVPYTNPVSVQSNFAGLASTASTQTAVPGNVAYLVQGIATGTQNLTDANFTSSTIMQGVITCGTTQ